MPLIRGPGAGTQIMQYLTQASIGTEILYSFVIIAISLIIYFGTKELYNLTSHKGIKYFRMAFLFFAIAFFFRSFIKFLILYFDLEIFDFNLQMVGMVSFLIFMYASSMAIFYLLYSVMWKKWTGDKIIIFHILAAIIAVIALLVRSSAIILLIHIILFIFLAIVTLISYYDSKKRRKGQHLHGVYILLFAFWILNIIDLTITNALGTFQILIYLASLSVFLAILYKVIQKAG